MTLFGQEAAMSNSEICSLAYEGKGKEVKELIKKDSSLASAKDESGRIPLHWACSAGHSEIVQFLFDYSKAGFDEPDDAGWTPLMISASAGRTDIVKFLIEKGASVSVRNKTRQTPLHYAASKAHMQIVKLLMDHNAEVNARDSLGATPLHRASAKGNTAIVSMLLGHCGCDVNIADAQGNTPLHLACEEDRRDEAKMLVKSGAYLDKLNKVLIQLPSERKSPLDLAEPGLRKILSRLAESG
ncbi:unnamed protein product [Soboliphyme baturini]|uniref:ANK_REP_REGION domain-containing protein n=1 Tax=Soboliphyme baturini TaxID=241478 RepID=A0A183IB60_9BILA|nr:unnamed protein product [Soboliphyme baturini]